MTARRTVTVETVDHGPVTVTCPSWCLGVHPDGGYRVDITHAGRVMEFEADTSRGPVVVLLAALELRPFTELPPGPVVFVNVEIGGDWYPSSPGQLESLAAALVGHAARLHGLAERLAELRGAT